MEAPTCTTADGLSNCRARCQAAEEAAKVATAAASSALCGPVAEINERLRAKERCAKLRPAPPEANINLKSDESHCTKSQGRPKGTLRASVPEIEVALKWEREAQSQSTHKTTTTAKTTTAALPATQSDASAASGASTSAKASAPKQLERLLLIFLPLIFALLLPSAKLRFDETALDGGGGHRQLFAASSSSLGTGQLLLALVRLPFDRLRLECGSGLLLGEAKELTGGNKNDLQEEETHMLLVAPAEQRSSYAGPQAHGYQPVHSYAATEQAGDAHAQTVGGEYASANGDAPSLDQSAGLAASQATGESGVVAAESAVGQQQAAGSSLQARSDLPAVRALNVKCEKNHMTVNIVFDRPFYGMVFSKGHYNDQKCVHLPPSSGQTSVNFDIHLGKCGMSSSDAGSGLQQAASSTTGLQQQQQQQPNGVFIENTIIIQYDPLVQEIYDQARKLRCTWYDYYEKSVTFRPYNVDMLDAVTANFLGDNIQCWMQIQVGKGPWSSEVAGIVKIGQTMTMVLAIKDDENRFDMLVRNCVAHDGKHQPIQLVDEYGCVARPKIMGRFQKVRNFGPAATVVSYAHFQAFKFPDSMSVHFQCVIQVCRYECPEPVCQQQAGSSGATNAGELGGGGAVSISGTTDYAASGTEMVASKEPLSAQPHSLQVGQQPHHFLTHPTGGATLLGNHAHYGHHHGHQSHHPSLAHLGHQLAHSNRSLGSAAQLKLDESQGRVQVKLDTSIMAALNGAANNGRPPIVVAPPSGAAVASGPLPPHLLHMATQEQTSVVRAPMAPNGATLPYRQMTVTSGQQQASQALLSRQQQTGPMARAAQQPSQPQLVSFSPQFPLAGAALPVARRSSGGAFANRLGESASSSNGSDHEVGGELQTKIRAAHASDQLAPPYEAEYAALGLIAAPRGLRIGDLPTQAAANNHRVRRATEVTGHQAEGAAPRKPRHLSTTDSTSVQTHKTIQVVSPDDVAFSLLLNGDEDGDVENFSGDARGRSRAQISGFSSPSVARQRLAAHDTSNSVCFSAARLLWSALMTLAALISGIVIIAYVILRQRSQLAQKLSAVYAVDVPPSPLPPTSPQALLGRAEAFAASSPSLAQSGESMQTTAQLQTSHGGYLQHLDQLAAAGSRLGQVKEFRIGTMSAGETQRRQHQEVEQRNNYLSRLCSQFAPAAHWR